ncbi:MAG: cobalamin-binding protein [Anaerolineales bacterium]|nr:MAG: cobalamin-binding protein [Anaerolineales bacterium]
MLRETVSQEINELFNAILEGKAELAKEIIEEALINKLSPSQILNQGMIASMAEVGDRFERGEYYVPEMLIAARAMQQALSILKPHLKQSDLAAVGRVVIGTVKGDLHDIGKNLVGMLLEGAGFEIRDLGTDVSAEQFVEAVRGDEADILAMSALLTTTMPNMKSVVEALHNAGLRDRVKVIIGGAPVTESYSQEIGADGYAPDASRAVKLVKTLL